MWVKIALIVLAFSIMITGTACTAGDTGKKDVSEKVEEIVSHDFAKRKYKTCIRKLKRLLKEINKDEIPDGKDIALVECNLALCYIPLGDYEEAETYLKDAKQKSDEIHLEEYPVDAISYTYGQLEVMRNNHEEAVAHFEEALKWRKMIYGEESSETGSLYIELAFSYLQLHQLDEAEQNAQLALNLDYDGLYGCMIPTNAYIALGDIRMEQENYKDGVLMYENAKECYVSGGQPLGENMLKMIEEKRMAAFEKA